MVSTAKAPLWQLMTVHALLLVATPTAGAATNIELPREADVTIVVEDNPGAGNPLTGVGDVNGDGVNDIAIGDCGAGGTAGATHVLFGPFEPSQVDLRRDDVPGFRIDGATPSEGDSSGDGACQIARAGDVNGDGLADVIIGAPYTDNNQRSTSGTAYIVFGKTDESTVDLELFDLGLQGMQGYRIDGSQQRALVGLPETFDGAGDVNGDGLDDVVIGAVFAGSAFVVFGKESPEPVDLLNFDTGVQADRGYRIDHRMPDTSSLYSVAGPGDVSGDGVPDMIIGVVRNVTARGSAYVVFGKATTSSIDTRSPGRWGYRIRGGSGDRAGYAVSEAGDVNGDGRGDVLVGAPRGYCCPRIYVVFGKKGFGTVKLASLGNDGYSIRGPRSDPPHNGWIGQGFIARAGDINGDGRPDSLIGAPAKRKGDKSPTGAAYVVYGKRGTRVVRLAHLGNDGFRIKGAVPGEWVGGDIAGPGDVNGDGIPDILIGSRSQVYLVWGREG